MGFWSTQDLSEVTAQLVAVLQTAIDHSGIWTANGGTVPKFTIALNGNSPDSMRENGEAECQLNLYLLHVGQDPFFRNTPVLGPGAMANTQQPLGLNLTYLLTAYAPAHADQEQQVMSIALGCFHERQIYVGTGADAAEYLTVSLGTDTLSDMSALWQSFSVGYRLSALYRVAVAFLTPSQPPIAPFPSPKKMGLTVAPAPAPLAVAPQLFQPARQVAFTVPADGLAADVGIATSPLAIAAGETVLISGQGLSTAAATDVFLTTLDGATSWKITSLRLPPVPPAGVLDSELSLQFPANYMIGPDAGTPPPATTPPPGLYLLAVGAGSAASPAIPVTIVPRFDNPGANPVLHPSGGGYNFTGAGFVPGATQLFVGGVMLNAGAVTIDGPGTKVGFSLPAHFQTGILPLRVRVEGVDAPATWAVAA